jgi:histidyl-tRNA synthetase
MAEAKKQQIKRPRGTRDILPEDWKAVAYVAGVAGRLSAQAGFSPIFTPSFEDTALFSRGVGEVTDIVEKEMFTFEDRSGNSLSLKPEGTAPIVRAYLEDGMQSWPHPVKLSYVDAFFRYDRPQKGRYRQFMQYGVELIGDPGPKSDAEVIDLGVRILRGVGLRDFSVQVGTVGCPDCRGGYTEELTNYLNKHLAKLSEDSKRRVSTNPMRVLDSKDPKDQKISAKAPVILDHLCKACKEHFYAVLESLDELDVSYELNPRLVRGLDYYTRTTFEMQPIAEGGQSTLLAGGRYDGLVEQLGGKPTPAIGFSGGVERAVLAMEEQKVDFDWPGSVDVYVAQMGDAARKKGFRLISELRNESIGAVWEPDRESLKAQLGAAAERYGARFSAIIGQKEVLEGTVILRDMQKQVQEAIPAEEAVVELKRRLER